MSITSDSVLLVDTHLPRTDIDTNSKVQNRPVVQVAVGILVQPNGSFLLTTRPEGKVYAGYWEFPGGKIEVGETVSQALIRELHEELGVQAQPEAITHWYEQLVDYPHARVHLHFCCVTRWHGALQMREGQHYAWSKLPVTLTPILPGALPILEWMMQNSHALNLT
jgi:8-oxo-dGTP diphosphatase